MITLTQSEARSIQSVSNDLLKKALPATVSIPLADRYEAITEALRAAEEDADISIDFPLFPISAVKKAMPKIEGRFFIGAMRKMFDFEN